MAGLTYLRGAERLCRGGDFIHTHTHTHTHMSSPNNIASLLPEKEEWRERNTDMKERQQLVASHTCLDWASNPQLRYVP